jgi:AraC-like DNA-binding protein
VKSLINDTIFCKDFIFRLLKFKNYRYTDARDGIGVNYLAYMKKGSARITTDSETVNIFGGDIFFIPNGCKYRSYWYGEADIEFITLSFPFMPNFENRLYKPQTVCAEECDVELMKKILNAGETPVGVGMLYTLIGRLMPRMLYRKGGKASELISKATEMMTKEPKITVKEIARRSAVSQSALYSAFKRHSDKSLGQVRCEILMKNAKDALISTDAPIEEIAESLSFSSSAYFRKCFKDYFGISPREMRKKHSLL